MKVVPQLLYKHKNVRKIMVDGLSCIVHKTVDTIDVNTDHFLASHVLSVVLKGELNLETYYEGESYFVTKNQLVFIPKGRYMISDIIPKNGEFEAVFFFFEAELLNQFLLSIKKQTDLSIHGFNLVLKYTDKIRVFTESILSLYTESASKEVTKIKLLELLYLIYNSEQQNDFLQILHSLNSRKKRNIEELMLENFDKSLSIEDYAYLTGRSVSSFKRDFQRQFNTSPGKWLIKKRLEKAEYLLASTDQSIQQISVEVGYENVSHFVNIFGRYYGLTPKQFLIQHRINKAV
ncbi:AraC family transcriptional regulator [uncultured Flavobacterium sp.]|uniref:helix-turn-helix domain-containing protein n=1 Tax=uncultured Flavobacterium sp. TaxID=165435 RepID=UPI00292E621D|nr:AraC family transcriptional regulator [uncultured Flavobacterium sp.]